MTYGHFDDARREYVITNPRTPVKWINYVGTLDFGGFVELEEGIEGLVHVSEISREKVEKPSDVLKVGETVSAIILHIDAQERRIGLSIKGMKEKAEKAEIEKYISNQGSTSPSLGELIQEEMERKGGWFRRAMQTALNRAMVQSPFGLKK